MVVQHILAARLDYHTRVCRKGSADRNHTDFVVLRKDSVVVRHKGFAEHHHTLCSGVVPDLVVPKP